MVCRLFSDLFEEKGEEAFTRKRNRKEKNWKVEFMAQATQLPRCNVGEANSGSGAVASLVAMADYMLCQQPQRVSSSTH